jgi:hypothetical protein
MSLHGTRWGKRKTGIIAIVRGCLNRKLSPPAFQYVRYCWWNCSFYLPRLIASTFVQRMPKVHAISHGYTNGDLFHRLRGINVFAPTKMCRVMTRHGSDKGVGVHNYTAIYSVLFGELRKRPLRVFELGLGTNDINLPSSMAGYGQPGGSLRGWRELFPQARVYGADIDRGILFDADQIKTFYCDQLDRRAVRDLWAQPDLLGGADIIIDDGLHTFEGNTSFLEGSLESLRPGGVYVIEDIDRETLADWHYQLDTYYSKQFPSHVFALVELPNSLNDRDNNLLIIHKRC